MKTYTSGAGQFAEFDLTREWNEVMKMMWTDLVYNKQAHRKRSSLSNTRKEQL